MGALKNKIYKEMLKRKKIYILPTRFGVIFIGGLFAMLLTAAAYANNLVYLLTFLLTAILLIAMAEAHNNMRGVFVYRQETEPGAEDDTVKVRVWLRNINEQPRFSVFVGFTGKKYKKAFSQISLIPQKSIAVTELSLPVDKRGVYKLPDLRLFTIFPLGLFYCWRIHQTEAQYFVYPKPVGQQKLPEKQTGYGDQDNPFTMGGEDFRGHAAYQVGESQRHIDWKAYARGRPLLVKKFDLGDPRIRHLDFSSTQGEDIDVKLRQLSSWVWTCHKNQDLFSLQIQNLKIEPGFGPQHLRDCLVSMARVEQAQ